MNITNTRRTLALLMIAIGLVVNGHAQSFLTNGLVAYYPFNGNANDASGNGNNCVVSGALLGTDRFGNVGNSYSFTTFDQYIQTGSSVGFPKGTNDFSVSVWVSLDSLITDHQIIFANGVINQFQFGVRPSSSTMAPLDFHTGGDYPPVGGDVTTASVTWVPDQWYNLQIVRSQNTVTVYRNGSIIGQNEVFQGNDAASADQNLRFGRGVPPQAHQLYGQLDDIRIYNRALSGSEVQQLYSFESAGYSFESAGLIAYYPFNGNANDESGNGNHGTVNGATLTTDRFGVSGKAMSFNGINQFIQSPHQSYLNFPSGDFTMSFWASLNDTNKYQFFMGKDMGPGGNPKWIIMYGSAAPAPPLSLGFSFHVGTPPSGGGWYAGSDTKLKSGVWQHVLARKTSSQYDFFIDGAHVSTGTGLSTLPQNNTAPLTIGNAEGSGAMLNGKLDDIRIYGRSLSDSEVQQLYAIKSGPRVDLIKAVKPSFSNLTLTTNYQMQMSGDLNTWTNQGSSFTATNTSMVYPQYFDVDNWGSLFFRLQVVP